MHRLLVLLLLVPAACHKALPDDLLSAGGARALVDAVSQKLGQPPHFDRLSIGAKDDDVSIYVVDPTDAKKLLAYDVKEGRLVGPSPVTRAGDVESTLTGQVMGEAELAGLAKAVPACLSKLKASDKQLTQLRYDDGWDMVHHEQDPPGWIIETDASFCRATLAGEITSP
jgi:hypothetical protein